MIFSRVYVSVKPVITDNLIEEIIGQLSKRKLVKIKINKGIYERDDRVLVWEHLAEATSSVVVLARGNVGVSVVQLVTQRS